MAKKLEEKKKNIKKKDNKERFIPGIKKELKLVKWPTFKDMLKYTVATLILCVIFVLFFELVNLFMAFIKGLFN